MSDKDYAKFLKIDVRQMTSPPPAIQGPLKVLPRPCTHPMPSSACGPKVDNM